jgi:zinc transporter ZupT
MRKEFLMLFIAIASHKLISGLALSSRFLKEGATTKQVGRAGVGFSSCAAGVSPAE